MYNTEEQKKAAAHMAASEVKDGMILGLGTGSTVYYLIRKLSERIQDGLDIHVTATSLQTENLAAQSGIALLPFSKTETIHLAIDGVDAIDPEFYSIKGGGGALFREKVIAQKARRVIWIMDQSKLRHSLGGEILPAEVPFFAVPYVQAETARMGFTSVLRMNGKAVFVTDNGNCILDLTGSDGVDYRQASAELKAMTGILETGLFGNICEKIIVGTENGAEERFNPVF